MSLDPSKDFFPFGSFPPERYHSFPPLQERDFHTHFFSTFCHNFSADENDRNVHPTCGISKLSDFTLDNDPTNSTNYIDRYYSTTPAPPCVDRLVRDRPPPANWSPTGRRRGNGGGGDGATRRADSGGGGGATRATRGRRRRGGAPSARGFRPDAPTRTTPSPGHAPTRADCLPPAGGGVSCSRQ